MRWLSVNEVRLKRPYLVTGKVDQPYFTPTNFFYVRTVQSTLSLTHVHTPPATIHSPLCSTNSHFSQSSCTLPSSELKPTHLLAFALDCKLLGTYCRIRFSMIVVLVWELVVMFLAVLTTINLEVTASITCSLFPVELDG